MGRVVVNLVECGRGRPIQRVVKDDPRASIRHALRACVRVPHMRGLAGRIL